MCLWAIYIFPGSVYIFPPSAEQADPSWEYIIRSQTHECGIGTEAPIFLFWEYLFQIFGIMSLQCAILPHSFLAYFALKTSVLPWSFLSFGLWLACMVLNIVLFISKLLGTTINKFHSEYSSLFLVEENIYVYFIIFSSILFFSILFISPIFVISALSCCYWHWPIIPFFRCRLT